MMQSLFIICSFLLGALAQADDFDDMQREFETFSGEQQRSFQRYYDANDATYVQWLSEQWQDYQQFSGVVRDPVPKPAGAPALVPERVPEEKAEQQSEAQPRADQPVASKPHVATKPSQAVAARVTKPAELTRSEPIAQSKHRFYGAVWPAPNMHVELTAIHTEVDVAAGWQRLSHSDFQRDITVLKQQQVDHRLSDWAVLQLLRQQAEPLFEQHNQRQLYVWFFMTKLGYQVQLGFDDERLVLLFASQQAVYEKPFYRLGGQTFYVLGTVKGQLRLPQARYPHDLQALDLRFAGTLYRPTDTQQRVLEVDGKRFTITTVKPRNRFLDSYPQLDLQHYLGAPIAAVTAASLKQQLLPELTDKTPLEQVSWLLRWVQFGFEYQVDNDQFGEENYFHPEENFVFAANDCEDRTFILSWLVRELVGLTVVGLNYPGHVALAVAFPVSMEPNSPATLEHGGKPYWIADPTYIGAGVGQVMPQYHGVEAQPIEF